MNEMESITVSVVLTDDGRLVFDGLQELVRLCTGGRFMERDQPSGRSTDADAKGAAVTGGVRSERELIAEKRPRNQTETVAVLAFCLAENGQAEFTEADMKRAYIRAGVRPPKVIGQAVRDAKNGFDFIESGSKRGSYKLSAHGDRTVRFDLPRAGE
jgi:hypothetical protein